MNSELTVRTLSGDGPAELVRWSCADSVDGADTEHVLDALVQTADRRRRGLGADSGRWLPRHAQSLALLNHILRNVAASVVLGS